jgi:HJR/Mrr/RecB family endonuclease
MARGRSSRKQNHSIADEFGAMLEGIAQLATIFSGTSKRRRQIRNRSRGKAHIFSQVVLIVVALIGIKLAINLLADQSAQATVLFTICASIIGFYAYKRYLRNRKVGRILAIEFSEIDSMTGHAFEHYVGELLLIRGYKTTVTRGSGDNGVDVIAEKDTTRWAVQCKRQTSNVSRHAISDAVAATNSTIFKCNRAMVITNHYFSKAAIEYATSTSCTLVDRDCLAGWIIEAKSAHELAKSNSSFRKLPFQ